MTNSSYCFLSLLSRLPAFLSMPLVLVQLFFYPDLKFYNRTLYLINIFTYCINLTVQRKEWKKRYPHPKGNRHYDKKSVDNIFKRSFDIRSHSSHILQLFSFLGLNPKNSFLKSSSSLSPLIPIVLVANAFPTSSGNKICAPFDASLPLRSCLRYGIKSFDM